MFPQPVRGLWIRRRQLLDPQRNRLLGRRNSILRIRCHANGSDSDSNNVRLKTQRQHILSLFTQPRQSSQALRGGFRETPNGVIAKTVLQGNPPMPIRFTFRSFLLSAAVVLPASLAAAADDAFERQDSNQDGVLSGREATDLKLLDQDGDGEISEAEFNDAASEQKEQATRQALQLFEDRDANGDQRLSGTEMSGYEEFDKNGDRRLTEIEFKTGFASADSEIRNMSFPEIRKTAADRFSKIDINEDDRLTGTEAAGSGHFDRNADSRIVKEEFILGLILSTASPDSVSPDNPMPARPTKDEGIHKALADFVKALDDAGNAKLITSALHSSIVHQVDLPILEYALTYAKTSHGKMKLPPKSQIHVSTLENGDVDATTELNCEKGALKLAMHLSQGKIVGFTMDSPELQEVETSLYQDLLKDELQQRFANFYAIIAEGPLESIMKGEDDVAAAWIHPSVVEEVGRDKFYGLFQQIRDRLTEVKSTELETFKTEVGTDNIRTFTVTQIVTGTSSVQRYATTFQCVGMDAVVTGLSIENMTDITPAPGPKPVMPADADKTGDWFGTVSVHDGISFRMPGEASRTEKETPQGDLTRFQYDLPEQEMMFQIDIINLKVDISSESKTFFDTVRTQVVEESGGELREERLLDQDGPLPSQVLVVQKGNGPTTILRSVVDGSRVYSFLWTGPTLDDNTDHNFARPFHESIRLVDEGGAERPGFTTAKSKKPEPESSEAENAAPPASPGVPTLSLPSFLRPKPPVQAPSDDDLALPPAVAAPVDPVAPPASDAPPAPAPPM